MVIKQEVFLALLLWIGWAVHGASLNLLGDFDAQARHLLSKEMLTSEEIHNILQPYVGLRDALRTLWKDTELIVYGSLCAGLGTKTSDVDFHAQIPNFNESAERYYVQETMKILRKEPDKYILNEHPKGWDLMVSLYDIPTQRHIDLTFHDYNVEDCKLVYYYLNLDERNWQLAAIIKYWCKVHELTVKGSLPNYAVYLMTIFYLQQKNMCPSGFAKQAHSSLREARDWNTNVIDIPYIVDNDESLYELLGGFFKYYSEFNFKEYCVSTFAGRAILRSNFEDINRIPDEFYLYKNLISTGKFPPLDLHSDLCIQDSFEHNDNVIALAPTDKVSTFLDEIKVAAKMYDELSSDQFLGSILFVSKHNETVPEGEQLVAGQLN